MDKLKEEQSLEKVFFLTIFARRLTIEVYITTTENIVNVQTKYTSYNTVDWKQRVIMELDLQIFWGLYVHSRTHTGETLQPPSLRIWAHMRGRYWPAKIDDEISL